MLHSQWQRSEVKLPVKARVHWQSFLAEPSMTVTCDSHYCTSLGHLGWHDTDGIVSIFCHAAQGGQGKYKCVTVMCHCCWHYNANLCQCKHGLRVTHGSHYYTCLGHLGWRDANRNDPISVALPKVAKAST